MELRVLRYFLAIARAGSMTKAADYLHVTQPTLSRQIKELEQELGCTLFMRGSHSVSLTLDGMRLKKRAEEMVELLDKTKAEFKQAPEDNIAGDVYIGGGETQGMRLIAKVIANLQQRSPQVRFHLYSGNAADVSERLDKGLLDFGVLIQPTDLSKYDSLPLPMKDVWGVLMPAGCPLAQKKAVTKQDLLTLPLIGSRQAIQKSTSTNEFIKWFGEDFEKLNFVATYNLVFNAAFLVEQGAGYVLTLDKLVQITDNKNLCFRPLSPILESGLDIVWKKNRLFSPPADIFFKTLQKKLDLNRRPIGGYHI